MKTKIALLLLAAGLGSLASADPLKITRAQASEIYLSLAQIEPGLSAANAVTVADDINALRPHVEALDKGKTAAQRQIRGLPKNAVQEAAAQAILDELDKKSEEPVTVEITRFDLTPDEITAAKIRPLYLATLRQFLKPLPGGRPGQTPGQ